MVDRHRDVTCGSAGRVGRRATAVSMATRVGSHMLKVLPTSLPMVLVCESKEDPMFGLLKKKSNQSNLSLDVRAVLSFTRLGRDLDLIASVGRTLEVDAGEVVIAEGSVGDEALIIVEGTAAVSRADEVIAHVGRGDLVGEAALLTGEPRNATLIATSPLTLVAIDEREFRWLCLESRVLGRVARELVAKRSA